MTSSSQARRGRRASTPAPPDRSARVSVRQATGLSGVATVGVTGPDGITQTYHAYFARRAHSDEFNGTAVGPQWTWIRPDPANEQVTGGSLTITAEHADLIGNTNNARNIPRAARARELADRVEADVHHPAARGDATGRDHRLPRRRQLPQARLGAQRQRRAARRDDRGQSLGLPGDFRCSQRCRRRGYSETPSGCGWSSTALATRATTQPTARTSRRYTTPARAIKVGLFAHNGPVTSSHLKVSFEYFQVHNTR
jgi:hypothetical protein